MRFGLILGDQLNHQLATLKYLNREEDIILMAEVPEETTCSAKEFLEQCPFSTPESYHLGHV